MAELLDACTRHQGLLCVGVLDRNPYCSDLYLLYAADKFLLGAVLHLYCRTGKETASIVLGEVVLVHIADGVAGRSPSGKLVVDAVKLRPVCRLGGVTYGSVTELYDIPRPDGQGRYTK